MLFTIRGASLNKKFSKTLVRHDRENRQNGLNRKFKNIDTAEEQKQPSYLLFTEKKIFQSKPNFGAIQIIKSLLLNIMRTQSRL